MTGTGWSFKECLDDHEVRLRSLEHWRDRYSGAFILGGVILSVGLGLVNLYVQLKP